MKSSTKLESRISFLHNSIGIIGDRWHLKHEIINFEGVCLITYFAETYICMLDIYVWEPKEINDNYKHNLGS